MVLNALLDQLPTLLAVIVGAAGAMASSTLTDRLRWRRDQAVRWDQRRLDAYIAFISTLKDAVRISYRLTAPHRDPAAHPIDRAALLGGLEEAQRHNSKNWESLLLLGDATTVDAARRWREAAAVIVSLAAKEQWDEQRWTTAVHELDRTRDEFHAVARRSLGVTGSVDQFPFLRELHGESPTPRLNARVTD